MFPGLSVPLLHLTRSHIPLSLDCQIDTVRYEHWFYLLCLWETIGLPFLSHNRLVIDPSAQTVINKDSGYDLLAPITEARLPCVCQVVLPHHETSQEPGRVVQRSDRKGHTCISVRQLPDTWALWSGAPSNEGRRYKAAAK